MGHQLSFSYIEEADKFLPSNVQHFDCKGVQTLYIHYCIDLINKQVIFTIIPHYH